MNQFLMRCTTTLSIFGCPGFTLLARAQTAAPAESFLAECAAKAARAEKAEATTIVGKALELGLLVI